MRYYYRKKGNLWKNVEIFHRYQMPLWYFLVSMKHRSECSVCFTIPAYLILHLSYLKKQILKWLEPLLFKKQRVAHALVWCRKGGEDEAWFELGWITSARSCQHWADCCARNAYPPPEVLWLQIVHQIKK